jgi:hypothetical protein
VGALLIDRAPERLYRFQDNNIVRRRSADGASLSSGSQGEELMSGLSSRSIAACLAVLAVAACGAATARAQGSNFPPPKFVHFGPHEQTQGALYMPDPAVYPKRGPPGQ